MSGAWVMTNATFPLSPFPCVSSLTDPTRHLLPPLLPHTHSFTAMRPRRHTLSTLLDVAHRTHSHTSSTSSSFTLVLVDDGECQLWPSSARRVELRLAPPEWTVLQAAIVLYAPPSWFVMGVDVMVVIQDEGVQLVTTAEDWEVCWLDKCWASH